MGEKKTTRREFYIKGDEKAFLETILCHPKLVSIHKIIKTERIRNILLYIR